MEEKDYYNVQVVDWTSSSSTELPPVLGPAGGRQFEWPEYLVFGVVLSASVAIGVFYGCFGSKQSSNEEYLLGNRRMHPVPVALSLLCSYVSSITLLGHPVEIYLFGTQLIMVFFCYIPLTLTLAYIIVPLYYNLQLTSVYEYLEMRFNRKVRIALSLINVVYSIFYMSMVVYGPALALSYVTGIDHRILVVVIFVVCIFYSTLGGYQAVLMTDSLQAIIMFISMGVVVILGISFIDGGLSTIWQRALDTKRVNFFNFDVDPRTRHTFWTAIIGGYFTWLPMYANQAQIQRYISLPSLNSVKVALLINLLGLYVIMGLCYLAGLVIYGTYFDCDPLLSGRVKAVDQLLPIFVMDTLGDYPGLPGLFVAGITCAGLSTVSSGVNALAASITEDYVKKWKPNLTDSQMALVSKGTALGTGLLAFAFVFIAEQMGSIFSAATTLLGILGGPTLGIFICGQFFPWTNTIGAVGGMVVTFAWMTFLGVGSTIANNRKMLPNQMLALSLSGPNCLTGGGGRSMGFSAVASAFDILNNNGTTETPDVGIGSGAACTLPWKECEFSVLIQMFSLSSLWYPAVGCVLAVFFGLSFSLLYRLIHGTKDIAPVQSKLIVPLLLRVWVKLMPKKIHTLVNFDETKLLSHSISEKSINASKTTLVLENLPPPPLLTMDTSNGKSHLTNL